MHNVINSPDWSQYLEIPRGRSNPVKLDRILAERLSAFMKAKEARYMDSGETHA